jgi:hypothetical protein
MKIVGHFVNGKVVFDTPPPIREGSVVDVELPSLEQTLCWSDPPDNETAEEWIARVNKWVESLPVRDIEFDDSRDSIYD